MLTTPVRGIVYFYVFELLVSVSLAQNRDRKSLPSVFRSNLVSVVKALRNKLNRIKNDENVGLGNLVYRPAPST